MKQEFRQGEHYRFDAAGRARRDGLVQHLKDRSTDKPQKGLEAVKRDTEKLNAAHSGQEKEKAEAGFLAVLETAQRYTPNDEYCFLTALGYYLRNQFAIEGGFKTSKRDALQYSCSLDEPAKTDEGEADPAVTRIIDEGAALAFDGVEYADFVRYARMVINAALDTLTERQAALLTACYLDSRNMEEAAEIAGFSCRQTASDAAERAAFRLSNGRYSRELRDCLEAFNDYHDYHYAAQIGSFTRYKECGISATEAGALVR